MHAHAYADGRAVRKARGGQRALGGRGRPDRLRRDGEDDEERVPFDADLEAAVFESVAEDARVRLEDILIAVGAELALELGRALDVGEKECQGAGRQPPPRAHPALILLFLPFAKTRASL